ncbi:MAG: sensor histidine kinase, partial [Treponema sp.]|nr:sensor histidine kinase [Treponema sp.]
DIADETLDQVIPKVVLQQLVENSITHGFTEKSGVMKINVRGFVNEGSWIMEISDNGSGFDEDEKTDIERKIVKTEELLNQGKLTLEIGGMGLLNIYARFLILFGNNTIFRIANTESGGAQVTVGSALQGASTKGT